MRKNVALISVAVVLLGMIAGFCTGYGRLNEKVNAAEKDIDNLQSQYQTIINKLDDIRERLSVVEAQLKLHMEETK